MIGRKGWRNMNNTNSNLKNLFSIVALVLPMILIYLVIEWQQQQFTYSLDDAYIHLALAQNIFIGEHGINAGEFSAPSSSILWPFLLTPFSWFEYFEYIPLVYNFFFCLISLVMLERFFRRYHHSSIISTGLALAFAISLNFYGLVFTGMEHSLHLMLTLVIALGLIELFESGAVNKWLFPALIIAPMIRYEALAISVPAFIFIALIYTDERKKALFSIGITIVLLLLYSAFLYLNLGVPLPSSVLIKSNATQSSGLFDFAQSIVGNFARMSSKYGFMFVLAGAVFFRIHKKLDPKFLLVLSVCLLFFAFGRYGWFSRYEVFFLVFISILCLDSLLAKSKTTMLIVLVLPLCFTNLFYATVMTPRASSNIYNQQHLISKFVRDFDQRVAVNDLGLISYRSRQYVLDLWGLGNDQARKARIGSEVGYISRLMDQHSTEHAIVYSKWLGDLLPSDYVHVADLSLNEINVVVGDDTVAFYSVNKIAAQELLTKLSDFNFEKNKLVIYSVD
jgi:hypothetical protein